MQFVIRITCPDGVLESELAKEEQTKEDLIASFRELAGEVSPDIPGLTCEVEVIDTPPQDYQQRVMSERTELEDRRAKLLAFLPTQLCKSLPVAEQERLHQQLVFMSGYSNILRERIAAFAP